MEPIPIVSGSANLASLCSQISACLNNSIDDTRHQYSIVTVPVNEIKGLSQVLDTISKRRWHSNFVAVSRSNDYENLRASVDLSLQDCNATLVKLHEILGGLEDETIDILALKQQVHSHYSAMQLALQIINVCIALHLNSSQRDVARELAELKQQISQAMDAVALQQKQASATDLPPNVIQENGRISSHIYRLALKARSFHLSVSTILEGNGSVSIPCEPLSLDRCQGIGKWAAQPVTEEQIRHTSTSRGLKEASSWPSGADNMARDRSNSDLDIESELIQDFEELERAGLPEMEEYRQAESYCLKAIRIVESSHPSPEARTRPLKAILAVIYCFQEKWNDAENILQSMSGAAGQIDPLAMHCLHAVSMAYLDKRNLDSADRLCRRALFWKRKVLGASHSSYTETVYLLSRIFDAKHGHGESEGWRQLSSSQNSPKDAKIHSWISYLMENTIAPKHVPEDSVNSTVGDGEDSTNANTGTSFLWLDISATEDWPLKAQKEIEHDEVRHEDQPPDVHSVQMIHQSTGPAREGLEEIIFNMRAKLFIFVRDSYEWTPHCVGDVMLLKHKKNRKTSLVMRDEKTFKVCASHYIFPHMDLSPSAGSDQGWVWDVEADISNGDPQAVTLAIHFEDSDKANAFKDAFTNAQQDNAPLFPYLTSQGLPCWL